MRASTLGAARDSLSPQGFLSLAPNEIVPDHSSLCPIRGCLPLEVHHELFVFVLHILEKAGLLHGKYLGNNAFAVAANAATKHH